MIIKTKALVVFPCGTTEEVGIEGFFYRSKECDQWVLYESNIDGGKNYAKANESTWQQVDDALWDELKQTDEYIGTEHRQSSPVS